MYMFMDFLGNIMVINYKLENKMRGTRKVIDRMILK